MNSRFPRNDLQQLIGRSLTFSLISQTGSLSYAYKSIVNRDLKFVLQFCKGSKIMIIISVPFGQLVLRQLYLREITHFLRVVNRSLRSIVNNCDPMKKIRSK